MSWNEKANNIGFPTFKLLPSTKNILRLTRWILVFDDFGIIMIIRR